MNNIISVTCAIIHFDNKVLAVQRNEYMSQPLKWEFPGGKVEASETEEECVIREIQEELNIAILVRQRLTSVIHQYENITIRLIPFIAEYTSGNLLLNEHKDYFLANKNELINLDWAEADVPILNEYLSL